VAPAPANLVAMFDNEYYVNQDAGAAAQLNASGPGPKYGWACVERRLCAGGCADQSRVSAYDMAPPSR
jgi:hypothetical protein